MTKFRRLKRKLNRILCRVLGRPEPDPRAWIWSMMPRDTSPDNGDMRLWR